MNPTSSTEAVTGRCAVVVEGGGMRGVFHAGVLDTFLERDFHPFDLAIGNSAGACNLGSHLAGQHGRNRRVYTGAMCDSRFIHFPRLLRGGHGMDLDWLWDDLEENDPLDAAAAVRNRTEYVVVATSAENGAAVYFSPTADDLGDILKGSCAVPVLYRGPVRAAGRPVIDGGIGDPIPVIEAYHRGARHIMVIRTRPHRYRKKAGWETRLGAWVYRRQPQLAQAIHRSPTTYCEAVDFIESPPSDCRVVQVAPQSALRSGRTTRDRTLLEEDYQLGRHLGEEAITAWNAATRPSPV